MGREYSTYGGQEKCKQGFGGEYLRERGHLEVLVIEGSVVLKWISRRGTEEWTGLIWLRIGTGSIKCGEFLDWLKNC
jgi:hypothetical protein